MTCSSHGLQNPTGTQPITQNQIWIMDLSLILMMSLTGCALLGTNVEIVKQSITPVPQEAKGLLYVATNKPILGGIEVTDVISQTYVGGY